VPVALSGRVDTAGVITLSGEGRMFLDDGRLWVYLGVRSWTTTLRDGRLSGDAVTARQELAKGGETLGALVTARGAVDFRQSVVDSAAAIVIVVVGQLFRAARG
jgi:hypothetical protein